MPIRPPRVVRRLLALFTWDARDREMEREMAFHLDALRREFLQSGLGPEEADRAARQRFGRLVRLKEQGHDVRSWPTLENVARDVRDAGRGLRRSPWFAAAVVLTLALGIGGNTAIFSLVDQLLLRPLPYPEGDRLVMIHEATGAVSVDTNSVSPANWLDWQRESRTLGELAAWRTASYTLTGAGDPVRVDVQLVSSEFFPLLGVAPLLGRTISAHDDVPDAPLVAVLSHDLWQRRFGGDPGVLGRVVRLDDRPFEVIGVMAAGFRFIYQDTGVWTAFRLDRAQRWREVAGRFMNVVGRLAPDATLASARAEMDAMARHLAATHAFNKGTTVRVAPVREQLTGQVQASLWVLYAAVGVLLAIACFNVANLLLARAASRRREMAIRTALGAGRLAIARQLLVESLLLALAGGALGILLARWSLAALVAVAPPDLLRVPDLSVDRRVLLYAVAVSVATGVLVGLVPALLVAGRSIVASLRGSGTHVTHSPRLRQALVVGQVALTVVLLCGAGLLVRTLLALDGTSLGFERRGVLTMQVALPPARYDEERRQVFYRDAVAALRALPGALSAAAADSLPVIGQPRGGTVFHRLGTPELPLNERPSATIRVITPGFFRTLGIPVLRGREFTPADDTAPGFVVNKAFVRAYLQDDDPLGVVMSVFMRAENPYRPIIGVVGDVNEGAVRRGTEPIIYYSHNQLTETAMTLFVRADRPEALVRPAVAAIQAIDPDLAVTEVRTIETALAESIARERLSALVAGGFALSGLLLSSLGLYGLLALLVTERTKEFGIRIALGARLGRLRASVIGGGVRLVGIGGLFGVCVSLLLLRSFAGLLFGVTPYDASTYVAVVALLCVVAVLASYLPANRAARVEPLVALRQD